MVATTSEIREVRVLLIGGAVRQIPVIDGTGLASDCLHRSIVAAGIDPADVVVAQGWGDPAIEMAARIRAERLRLGLTAAEVGAKLGVSRDSYKQLERSANPQYSRLVELVRVVGMDAKAIAPELFAG